MLLLLKNAPSSNCNELENVSQESANIAVQLLQKKKKTSEIVLSLIYICIAAAMNYIIWFMVTSSISPYSNFLTLAIL